MSNGQVESKFNHGCPGYLGDDLALRVAPFGLGLSPPPRGDSGPKKVSLNYARLGGIIGKNDLFVKLSGGLFWPQWHIL